MKDQLLKFKDADGKVIFLAPEAIEAIEDDFGRPFEEIPSWEVMEWLEN